MRNKVLCTPPPLHTHPPPVYFNGDLELLYVKLPVRTGAKDLCQLWIVLIKRDLLWCRCRKNESDNVILEMPVHFKMLSEWEDYLTVPGSMALRYSKDESNNENLAPVFPQISKTDFKSISKLCDKISNTTITTWVRQESEVPRQCLLWVNGDLLEAMVPISLTWRFIWVLLTVCHIVRVSTG